MGLKTTFVSTYLSLYSCIGFSVFTSGVLFETIFFCTGDGAQVRMRKYPPNPASINAVAATAPPIIALVVMISAGGGGATLLSGFCVGVGVLDSVSDALVVIEEGGGDGVLFAVRVRVPVQVRVPDPVAVVVPD